MKKMGFFVVLLAVSQFVAAQTIYKTGDKFTGDTHFYTERKRPDLEGGFFFSRRYVYFNFHAFKSAAKDPKPYAITIDVSAPDWVFIQSGASLILKLDSKDMIALTGDGSGKNRSIVSHDEIQEIASYELSAKDITKIGKSKTIEFRVLGDKQSITGNWTPDMIADVAFLAEKGPTLIGATTSSDLNTAPPRKLGVQFVAVTKPLADSLKMPSAGGAFVVSVEPGSFADKSGIKQGDVIISLGGRAISTVEDLQNAVAEAPISTALQAEIWRGGVAINLEIQL